MAVYVAPGVELRRLAWPVQARSSLDFIVACMGDGIGEARRGGRVSAEPLPPAPEALGDAGFLRTVGTGGCLDGLFSEGSEAFSRPARVQAGDKVLFVADPDPRLFGKFFVGVRSSPGGGRDFLFYASALRLVIAVPEAMLRHVERTDFIRAPGGTLKPAPHCHAARRLAATLGCEPDADGIAVPSMSSAREAARAVGREIARRSRAFPDVEPDDEDALLPVVASLAEAA